MSGIGGRLFREGCMRQEDSRREGKGWMEGGKARRLESSAGCRG